MNAAEEEKAIFQAFRRLSSRRGMKYLGAGCGRAVIGNNFVVYKIPRVGSAELVNEEEVSNFRQMSKKEKKFFARSRLVTIEGVKIVVMERLKGAKNHDERYELVKEIISEADQEGVNLSKYVWDSIQGGRTSRGNIKIHDYGRNSLQCGSGFVDDAPLSLKKIKRVFSNAEEGLSNFSDDVSPDD